MRIGVDGRELGGQPTGVGRYLQRAPMISEDPAAYLSAWSPAGLAVGNDLVRAIS